MKISNLKLFIIYLTLKFCSNFELLNKQNKENYDKGELLFQKKPTANIENHDYMNTSGSSSQVNQVINAKDNNNQVNSETISLDKSNHHDHHKYAPHKHHNDKLQKNNNNNNNHQSSTSQPSIQKNEKSTKASTKSDVDELLVNTENGYVRGRSYHIDHQFKDIQPNAKKTNKRTYRMNAWLGIPFAEKPIGDLRFKRPVPIKNWNGTLNVTELPNTCVQLEDTVIPNFHGVDMWNPNTNVSEDCLYLNVWAPHPRPKNSAVWVWIYGGGFASGTSTLKIYDPKVIVAETQVIFVSIQYRVSIFGFLYMKHENAPGNQGLLDQNLALKWVHNNIQYFGGDSSKITIVGESAGSVSVSYHLVSPLSQNLFRNAILESGSVLADWTLLKEVDAVKRNTELVMSLGCNGTTYEMIECAKKVDARTAIEKADETFYTKANHGVAQYTFLPVVDNYFLEEEPITLLNRGKFKKCPILIGANKDEGNWFFVYAFPEYRNLTSMPIVDYELFKDFLLSLFYYYPQYPSTASAAILNAITYRYTNWNNVHNTMKNIENLDDAAGDFHFLCPTVDFANIYAMNQLDVYFYHYTQRSTKHVWPDWLGVLHADEISFVFGEPLHPEHNFTSSEKMLSRKILKYWSNFVKYENPNGPPAPPPPPPVPTNITRYRTVSTINKTNNVMSVFSNNQNKKQSQTNKINKNNMGLTPTLLQNIEYWPKYHLSANTDNDIQRAYLRLNAEKVEVDYNLRAEYCSFWGSLLPTLVISESRCQCSACNKHYQVDVSKNNSSNDALSIAYQSRNQFLYFLNFLCFYFVFCFK